MFPIDFTPEERERSKVSTRVHLENGLANELTPNVPKKRYGI